MKALSDVRPLASMRPRLSSRHSASLGIGTLLLIGFASSLITGFDADELQHLHAAWNIGNGKIPYRDFFDHHPPLFHILLAPFVRSLGRADFGLLLTIRLVALAILCALIALFHGLIRRESSRRVADWAVIGLILTYPFSKVAFQLRPDWPTLVLLLWSVRLLLGDIESAGSRTGHDSFYAGLLAGVAGCISQKAWFLGIGILLWALLIWRWAPDLDSRKQRGRAVRAFTAAATLPLIAMSILFVCLGDGRGLIEDTVLVNFRWGLEQPWWRPLQESLLPGFGLYMLAVVYSLRIFLNRTVHFSQASTPSLIAVLFVAGSISFRLSPSPQVQSLMFLVLPWMAALGTSQLANYSDDSSLVKSDRRLIAFSSLICLLGLRRFSMMPALIFSGLLARLWLRTTARLRPNAAFVLFSLAPFIIFIGRFSDSAWKWEVRDQLRFIATVEDAVPPEEPILSLWPVVAPFRPSASYHWFDGAGLPHALPPGTLDDEWAKVVAEGRVRIVIANRRRLAAMPKLAALLNSRCRASAPGPQILDRDQIFTCGP